MKTITRRTSMKRIWQSNLTCLVFAFGIAAAAQAQDERCCNAPESKWVKSPPTMPTTQCLAMVDHYPESHPGSGSCKGSSTTVEPPPTSGGGNGGSGNGGDGAGNGSGAGGGDGHGATNAFTREDVRDWSETKIQDELYRSDNRLRVYVNSLDGNQSLKDILDKKTENSAISKPLGILIAGINDQISSGSEVADNLKDKRTEAQRQLTCLNEVYGILNRASKGDGGFSEIICRNVFSFAGVTLSVSPFDPPATDDAPVPKGKLKLVMKFSVSF